MDVQPGVIVREYQTKRKNASESERESESLVKNGGSYETKFTSAWIENKNKMLNSTINQQSSNSSRRIQKMSLKEYQKQRGQRSYDMTRDL